MIQIRIFERPSASQENLFLTKENPGINAEPVRSGRKNPAANSSGASAAAEWVQITFALLGWRFLRSGVLQLKSMIADRNVARKGGRKMITLNLPPARPRVLENLCAGCVFAHIVRGHARGEEMFSCGYAFPLRVIPFAVRDCTDFKPLPAPEARRGPGFGEQAATEKWEDAAEFRTVIVSCGENPR